METNNFVAQDEMKFVAFNLGKHEYALPITSIQEIIMPQDTTHIPNSPDYFEGIINLRENIIPVINGRKLFGMDMEENTNESKIVILELDKCKTGLSVDSVSEVVVLTPEEIKDSPINTDTKKEFIRGIGKLKDRLLIILNPQGFLDQNELETVKSLADLVTP